MRGKRRWFWFAAAFLLLAGAVLWSLRRDRGGAEWLDLSRLSRGVVSARYAGETQGRVKVQITKTGGEDYNYDLNTAGEWERFTLTQGDGEYSLRILEQIEEDRYTPVYTYRLVLKLEDPLAPFLEANQFVNYTDTTAWALARRWNGGYSGRNDAERAAFFLDYVAGTLSYDTDKAAAVEPGYLPDLDGIMAEGKGICFDYAALLCALLRSAEVPCRLVTGYTGELYHAWVEVWCENEGEAAGLPIAAGAWTRLDPTFLSTRGQTVENLAYIRDDGNYRVRYIY